VSGPLVRLERALEAIVERPFARLFGIRPAPEQVARALERAIIAADRRPPAATDWVVRLEPGSPLLSSADAAAVEVALADELRATRRRPRDRADRGARRARHRRRP
jgi:hypothetical protein